MEELKRKLKDAQDNIRYGWDSCREADRAYQAERALRLHIQQHSVMYGAALENHQKHIEYFI